MIAKLLTKDPPHQIQTLNDLRSMTQQKIVVKKNSFVEELFAKSEPLQDFRPRISLEQFDVNEPDSIRFLLSRILNQEVVLVDDKVNFLNYLTSFPNNQFRREEFFFSDVIDKLPAAWIFPKGVQVKPNPFLNIRKSFLNLRYEFY